MRFASRTRRSEDEENTWADWVVVLFMLGLFVGVPVFGSVQSFMAGDWFMGAIGLVGFLLLYGVLITMVSI